MKVYKGSVYPITVVYAPCYCDDPQAVENLVLNFYTTESGTSIEFSGDTISVSGMAATVVFQPAQLDILDDGVLRYVSTFDYSGSSITFSIATDKYLKTPPAYTPMRVVTEDDVQEIVDESISASTAITEMVDEKVTEAMVDYVDEAELSDAMDAETARTEQTYLKEHQSLADYYTSAQTQQAISSALTGYYTSGQTNSAISTATQNMVTSTYVSKIWVGNSQAYAQLPPAADTLYFINDN